MSGGSTVAFAGLALVWGLAGCDDGADTPPGGECPGRNAAGACAWFEEVSDAVGLVPPPLVQTWAAGVAIGDLNGDGRADVLRSGVDHVRLWLQDAAGAFHDASLAWGLANVSAEAGLVVVDFDGDGWLDVAAASLAERRDVYLLRNEGGAGLADATEALGLASAGRAATTAWADVDADGDLDLFVARYDADLPDALWRNEDGATFTDLTADAGVGGEGTLSFQAVFFDADLDGDPDLYVTNDKATLPAFFLNDGLGRFADFSFESGVAREVEAMGVSADDFDGDGLFDLYVGNVPGVPDDAVGNLLHLGDGTGRFVEAARAHGAAVDRWTWGVGAVDPDLDGDLDLFVAVEERGMDGRGDVFLENGGAGDFVDASGGAGVGFVGNSYGLAVGDVDGDGRADVAVTCNAGLPALRLYLARGGGDGRSLVVRLAGAGKNRYGVGARVTVEAGPLRLVRELRAGEYMHGGGPPELYFGVGPRARAERVTVVWPSGRVTVVEDVATDRPLVVGEE